MEFHETYSEIYGPGVVMHVKFHHGGISYRGVVALWLSKFQWFFRPQPNLVPTNGWNFMKLILNSYDHDVVMHVKFFMVSSIIEELLSFDCLDVNGFFSVLSHN